VGLQRPLGDRGAVALVVEVVADALIGHQPAGGGNVALLHCQDDVVFQCLGASLDEDVVRGQPGGADAEPGAADDVLDPVGNAAESFALGDRVQVGVERSLRGGVLAVVQLAHSGAAAEAPVVVVHGRHFLQQLDSGA
jgi:hypothetical protein